MSRQPELLANRLTGRPGAPRRRAVHRGAREGGAVERPIVSEIRYDTSLAHLTVTGFPGKPVDIAGLVQRLGQVGVRPEMLRLGPSRGAPGLTDVSFVLARRDAARALDVLSVGAGRAVLECDETVARVSLTGTGLRTAPAVTAAFAEALSGADARILAISSTAAGVTAVIRAADVPAAVRALRAAFGLGSLDEDTADWGAGGTPEMFPSV
ncbi:ACT domain-containing protein [Streptomyces sp. NPDC093600]|uniref:ACT domain-containing protein n=1 Tax=Streptomyces sp. NPDC093600 TaxID=3366047 RepID=UPI00381D957D